MSTPATASIPAPTTRSRSRRFWKYSGWTLGAVGLLLIAFVATAWVTLRLSLPKYDGSAALAGLGARVTVTHDTYGVADIRAQTSLDAYRALGFLHGQGNFFEMDLMRRSAAAELSALLGPVALPIDRARRVHRFRSRAHSIVSQLDADSQARLAAYAAGVNAGLEQLRARPFPYLLLQEQPRPWTPEDSVLTIFAMFFELQNVANAPELAMGKLRRHLPAPYVDFLDSRGTEWDAAIDGSTLPDVPVPSADVMRIDTLDPKLFGGKVDVGGDFALGSNSWAVAGSLTATGAAMVANDMHLSLRVPNIWYRACLRFGPEQATVNLCGLTLPGVPVLVAGSNGKIAWSFTNSLGDRMDWVRVEWADAAKSKYEGGNGPEPVQEVIERIDVRGSRPEVLRVRQTKWGPIVHDDASNGALALCWTAHHPEAVNLRLARLETASTVAEALDIAATVGVPAQNFIVGDRAGSIGWTVIGAIPVRTAVAGNVPSSWEAPGTGWTGWLTPDSYPRVENPAAGRLWSANQRMVGGAPLELIGDRGYVLGARARQIRDALNAKDRFSPQDMLRIQLDDRALFLQRWWRLLRDVVEGSSDPALVAIERLTRRSPERASIDSSSYRLVRNFRNAVHRKVIDGLLAPMRQYEPQFQLPRLHQLEGPVWALVKTQPVHLLPPRYSTWPDLLVDAARDVTTELAGMRGGLASRTWGEQNLVEVRHRMSQGIPLLGRLLDMPAFSLPGDATMPRVQSTGYGASERFAVSPGHEDEAYLHMPGGQSGHPLSPFYGSGHAEWARGEPTPFLPGKAVSTMDLIPAGG